jgi:class 3 adenylate cyclase
VTHEERRLAAIMFSDICGFSATMGANESQALNLVNMHNTCIESAVEIHGGRIIKKMGDGLLLEFASAVNAVRCAVAVQKAVAKHNNNAAEAERFHLRIGIHVGDVVVADDDILGDGVNVASRIEPLAEPGGICISRDIFDLVKSKISIETVNLGPHDLKNISRQVEIYKVLIDAVSSGKTPALPTAKKAPPRLTKWTVIAGLAGIAVLLFLVLIPVKTGRVNRRARRSLETRQMAILKAIHNQDKEAALSLINPEILSKAGSDALWNRLRLASWTMKMGRISADTIRIASIDVTDDGKSARVQAERFRKNTEDPRGSWQAMPESKWVLLDDQWYLDLQAHKVKQKEQLPSMSPNKGPGSRIKKPRRRGVQRPLGR